LAKANREEAVEVLRGLAAFSVMWFHITNGNTVFLSNNGFLKESGSYGYLGVQAFFVISGFIIPYSLSLRNYRFGADGLSFLGRRLIRLEPAYLISAVLVVVLQIASALTPGSQGIMPNISGLTEALALHVAYLAPWFHVPWLCPVYWSLAIEFQYYLAMLFFAPLLLSRWRISVHIFLLSTAVLTLAVRDELLVFRYLPLFGLGFIRFLAFRMVLTRSELASWVVAFLALSWFLLGPLQTYAAVFSFCFLFIRINRPVPALSFLGAISYSLYLLHIPIGGRVVNLAVRLPAIWPVQLTAALSAVTISILGAYWFWRFIEKPAAELSKSIGSPSGLAPVIARAPASGC
jgi:peptidoglycan/LPS O-acetylase OafA/YrhL